MRTQELIELAVLDAMGLLDEAEREEFDAAFAAAAPPIQAQVRREQTRLSLSQHLLPDVEPPAGMRSLVLEAVRKAMASPKSKHREGARSGFALLALTPARQVTPLWRAASVGFAAAAMVLGVTFLQLRGQLEDLNRSLEADRLVSEMQGAAGSAYVISLLTDSNTVRRNFAPATPGGRGQASLFSNPSWGEGDEALLAVNNLPASDREFRVVTVDASGQIDQVVDSFPSQPGLQMVRLRDPRVNQTLAIAAYNPSSQRYQPIMVMQAPGLAWGGWSAPFSLASM